MAFSSGLPSRATASTMALVLMGMMLWSALFQLLALTIGSMSTDDLLHSGLIGHTALLSDAFWGGLFAACIAAPLIEESAFRWLFCSIAYDNQGQPRNQDWSLPIVVVFCGGLFATLHGFRYGWENFYWLIAVLGVHGSLLAWLWIRLARDGVNVWWHRLLACAAVHGAFNLLVSIENELITRALQAGYEAGSNAVGAACIELITKLTSGQ